MGDFKVVEYNHSYAKGVAEMWNRSSENWGGYNTVCTEEGIIKIHDSTSCLNVFLAVDGERVIGYCSFSEYREDGGALYIPSLNADPEYHGKGVGKALVLRAVERTLELGWKRLDLYTWPGNTKAVPLYKKCGFFWEKKDDTTHLINLIPTVLTTEAVSDYFNRADWYRDSKRVIEVKHDGIAENEFEYFEYSWEKDNIALRMQFEKTGRGLRLIETDDYIVSATVEAHALVFGKSYSINYDVVNKSGAPLSISIKGIGNKNIDFKHEAEVEVNSKETIKGEFYVESITEEQSEFRNHPTVDADIFINGKKATFRVGILPKFPCKLKLELPENKCFLSSEQEMFIDMENNFNEEASFKFTLEADENIEFLTENLEVTIGNKERKSIPIKYRLKNFHVLNREIPVRVKLKEGEEVSFSAQISGLFKGTRGIFWGETEKHWYIVNGNADVRVDKFDNTILPVEYGVDMGNVMFMYPMIGKPFSDELSKAKPEVVSFETLGDIAIMKASFRLKDFPGINFSSITKLYSNGIVEYHNEIENYSNSPTKEEIWLNQRVYYSLFRAIMPYENTYVENKLAMSYYYEHWTSDKLSENWLFSLGDKKTSGICWSPRVKMNFDAWFSYASLNLGVINPGEIRITEPIIAAVGTFKDWREFRSFALNTYEKEDLDTRECFEVNINNGNPFACEEVRVGFKEFRQTSFEGTIEIEAEKKSFNKIVDYLDGSSKDINTQEYIIKITNPEELVKVTVDYDSNAMELHEERTFFRIGKNDVRSHVEKDEENDVFVLDNGVISIKAAPNFSNSLFSLLYKNSEWLDSSYPIAMPKSWFNPWTGGIATNLNSMNFAGVLEEKRTAEFVKRTDNKGNSWEGIKISTILEKNKDFKGLELTQYFMLLPGVPVLCQYTEIYNNSRKYLNNEEFENFSFLKLGEDIKNSYVKVFDEGGKEHKFKSGRLDYDIFPQGTALYGSRERSEGLIIYSKASEACKPTAYINNKITSFINVEKLCIKHGEEKATQPMFVILTTEEYTEEQLEYLRNIKF